MFWPVAFEHLEFLWYSICEDQTSLALQRACRVNLRADIKDRRIAGALLTPPRGTDRLSIRCLFTCCSLVRQLHVPRPWNKSASSSNGPVPLSSSSHRDRDRFLGVWWQVAKTNWASHGIDSRDRHRCAKHCLTTKGGNCSSSHKKHFSRCPPRPVFHVPCIVCRRFGFRALHQCWRTALLQSDT